jgi:hypothetical protein
MHPHDSGTTRLKVSGLWGFSGPVPEVELRPGWSLACGHNVDNEEMTWRSYRSPTLCRYPELLTCQHRLCYAWLCRCAFAELLPHRNTTMPGYARPPALTRGEDLHTALGRSCLMRRWNPILINSLKRMRKDGRAFILSIIFDQSHSKWGRDFQVLPLGRQAGEQLLCQLLTGWWHDLVAKCPRESIGHNLLGPCLAIQFNSAIFEDLEHILPAIARRA